MIIFYLFWNIDLKIYVKMMFFVRKVEKQNKKMKHYKIREKLYYLK